MLIGVAGGAGSGKDTLGKWLVHTKISFKHYAFAEPIKQALNRMFGWTMENWDDREWKEKVQPNLGFSPRQAAQRLGTEWREAMGVSDLWCRVAMQRCGSMLPRTVITDVRFPHEQDWIHKHGGVVVLVTRLDVVGVAEHSSENSLDPAKVDFTYGNNGTLGQYLAAMPTIWSEVQIAHRARLSL